MLFIPQHVNRALNRLAQGNGLAGIHPNVARANLDRRIVKINADQTWSGKDVDTTSLKREVSVRQFQSRLSLSAAI